MLPRRLWPRLAVLMLAAILPLTALLALAAVDDGRRVVDAARDRAVHLAHLAAEQQDDLLQEASGLLRVLSRVPEVRNVGGTECDGLLRSVLSIHPRIASMAVVNPDSVVTCGTNPAAKGLSVADRPGFREVMDSQSETTVAMSSLVVSRVTGKLTMFLALPLKRPAGRDAPLGVILAGVDFDWSARASDKTPGLSDPLVQVLDSRDGAILAETPTVAGRVGQRFPQSPVIEAFRDSAGSGSLQAPDGDGVSRVFGFAALPGRTAGILVAIGFREDEVRAAANGRFWLSMGIASVAAAYAMLVAWLIARRTVLRPVEALVRAAALVGAGDLSARVSIGQGAAAELVSLGTAFARMAARLQARDKDIAAMQEEIAASERHHRLVSENANDMITRLSPDFKRLYVSPACRDVLGYEPEELIGNPPHALMHPDDLQELEQGLIGRLKEGNASSITTFRMRHKDGRWIWLETNLRRLEDGSGFVAVARDISERKVLEAQLEDANRQLRVLAQEDGLTRLANRRRFDEALGTEYRRAMRTGSPMAVIMIDVDRFKVFNDTYGHPGGDACLQAVAAVLNTGCRRPADLPARYGGEEFVLLLPNTDAAGALVVAECIRCAVRALAIPHAGSEHGTVTISVGVAAMAPGCPQGPAALVDAADAALYEAKRSGRNAVRLSGTPVEASAG